MSAAPDLPLKHHQASPPGTPVKTNNESNEASAGDARGLPDTVTEAEASSDNHGSVLSDNNRNVEVAAVDALQGFNMAGWIVTSYLVTYTGFLIIYSKLSDIFGCKLMLLLAITIFTVFSMACGASDSMVPLIVFRAFQGMGGSGIYSLSTIMVPLMVPPEKYATYISIMSSTFILSSVLGPILGGAITDHTTWRWVFYFNGPGGALAAVLLAFSVPFNFPYGESDRFFHSLASKQMWKRVDFVGMAVSLAASILIIFALEQGGVAYPWGSGAIVSTFVLSGVLWIAFVAWERLLSKINGVREPMFPWSLVHNRFVMGLLLNGFFTGFPFMAALINIPQRFQTVNMTSAINAGIRTLPLLLLSPLATAINGILVSKLGVPPLYTLFLGGSLQTIGVGLYSSLKSSTSIASAQYGYEAIMGLGFGFNLSTILMMVPLLVTEKDLAVTMGSVTQIRVLGGTIGLAVCSALLINHIKREAVKFLTAEQVAQILLSSENIGMLSPETQSRTRALYADAYSEQMRVMLYFSIASILSLVLLVERQPRKAPTKAERAA
ncbi:major facilitator superfamily transporter [Fusarium phyllophilum]|uniref:Major facilitator superfamily transporter n=1 Tax=Fusarium phyllophilum TaxID=47803 RepID=A0A8H5NFE6_9HYPO|nr:major facilitator superfamily transporter [Fusarium phyllophilum]